MMNTVSGVEHFWTHADLVIQLTAAVLLLMSLCSWYIIVGKTIAQLRYRRTMGRALNGFWQAESRSAALESIRAADGSGVFSGVATDAVLAAQAWEEQSAGGIGAGVDASEFIGRTLQQSIVFAQARVERGLTALASVGATAPFVGLFGTVWGVYHALVAIGLSGQGTLDKVAGPVGEALIMTALGLAVAIPAVLAYNGFVRANRLVLARLDAFAHDLFAVLTTGSHVGEARRMAKAA
jgi:biopolymer transport protein ExbB